MMGPTRALGATQLNRRPWSGGLLMLAMLALAHQASADDYASSATGEQSTSGGLLDNWLATSDAAKELQPHWMTPVVTVTPRLEQEFRYDQTWQNRPKDVSYDIYGSGKGLEIIPTPDTEVIIGVPAYQVKNTPKGNVYGWADETFLFKYRAAAGNEENGNYIVTGFLGLSVPSGTQAFTNNATVITPTIAGGKGWGTRSLGFDIQSTLGISFPTADKSALGWPINWNTAFQAHLLDKLWPEVEVSYTYYDTGEHAGKTQVAITPGIVFGRFEVGPRLRLIIGTGYQKTVSSFYIYNSAWILTARAAF